MAPPLTTPPSPAPPQLSAEQLIAMFILDAPVPIRLLYGIYGARSTFHLWRKAGLDVKHVEGMGPTVIPSRFKQFLLKLRGDWAPPQNPIGSHPQTNKANARAGRVRKLPAAHS